VRRQSGVPGVTWALPSGADHKEANPQAACRREGEKETHENVQYGEQTAILVALKTLTLNSKRTL
jgi:ADP-ribose pyrophosphatase YjhB (NUDIX family)